MTSPISTFKGFNDEELEHFNGRLHVKVVRCNHCHRRVLLADTVPAPGMNKHRCRDQVRCGTPAPIYADELADFHEITQADARRLKLIAPCRCCGAIHTWKQYLELPAPRGGSKQETTDEQGRPDFLELRNCACGSTLARKEPTP